jgi:hypothetical protein
MAWLETPVIFRGTKIMNIELVSEDRLRNTRAWAFARLGELSGADVIVSAIDELLSLRNIPLSYDEDKKILKIFNVNYAVSLFKKMAEDPIGSIFKIVGRYDDTVELQSMLILPTHEQPIDMLLFCPACDTQHVDKTDKVWTNPPHRTHQCQFCDHLWRPADIPTNGVATISTKGKNDGSASPTLALKERKERIIEKRRNG